MRFDVNQLRYLEKDAWRTLTAVEMGMKNHELVPAPLVDSIAGLRHGGAFKQMRVLLKHKLVHHENVKYDGYRLTPLGYDFLAIHAMVSRGAIAGVGRKIGVGKESDVYEVTNDEGRVMALKLHRLGRTSFRNVRQTRDYLRSRTASYNWLHLSHLSALKEYAFMQALHTHGFPVPQAVDVNRHAVLMALVDGVPLASLRTLSSPAAAWTRALDLMVRLAQHGLVHCDFNEFNLMVDDDPAGSEALTLIDFPQMVSTNHLNATTYYARDVACLQRFFVRRFDFRPLDAGLDDGSGGLHAALGAADPAAGTTSAEDSATRLDASLRASGFGTKEREQLEAGLAAVRASQGPGEGDDGGRDAYRRRGSDDEDEDEDEEDEGGDSVSEEETGEEEDELPSGGDGSDNGASPSDDGDGDHGDDGGIPDACEPSQSALAAALLQRQREMHAAVVDVEVDGAQSDDEDGTEGGAVHAATAPSVSVGLSARQTEVRDRLRAERRRAGGARAVAAGSVRRTNFSKDKSGSHKKGGNASASDAVWG